MPPATNGSLCFSLSLTFSILFLLIFGGLCTVNPHAIIPRILMCISVLFCYTISSVNYDDQPIEQDDRTRQHPNAVGLGKSAIKAIPTFVYDISTGTQCTICLSAMKSGELVKKLPICKHEFHVECIDTLLGSHSTCPNCRSEVQAPEDTSVVEISKQEPAVLLPRQPSSANRSASMSSMSSALTCGCDWLCTRGFQVVGAGNWHRKRPIWSSHQHQYCCQCSL